MSYLISTATVASPKTRSLRATIPEGMVAFLGIREGDKLEWIMDVTDNARRAIVTKRQDVKDEELENMAKKYLKPRKGQRGQKP